MQPYLMVGEVLKPQGVHGECKIKSFAAETEKYREWTTLYVKDSSGYTPLNMNVTRIHDGFVYAVIDRCATMSDAEKYRGAKLYVDRGQAAPLEDGAVYIADLIGCVAKNEKGESIGELRDVLQNGPVDTWVFQKDGSTWMAPALKTVFTDVDVINGLIHVQSDKLDEVAVFED